MSDALCDATELQIVDANDAILWDFNDQAGANNPNGIITTLIDSPDFGAPTGGIELFEPPSMPGGSLIRRRDGLVTATWQQFMQATSSDLLTDAAGRIASLLARPAGSVIKWWAPGAASPLYMDVVIGETGQLVRGQQIAIKQLFDQYQDMLGFPISIWRQPYFRGATISSLTNVLLNALLILDRALDGRPDNWTWDATTNVLNESIDVATEAYKFDVNSAVQRVLQQTWGTAAPGDVWTFSFYGMLSAPGQFKVQIEFLNNVNAVLATSTSPASTPASFARLSQTSGAAPANTTQVRASIVAVNSGAGTATYRVRQAQLEKAAAASPFTVGNEAVQNNPASGYGGVWPVYIQGNAPTPGRLKIKGASANVLAGVMLGKRSRVPDGGQTGDNNLTRFVNGARVFQLETGTMGIDTTATADANASSGSMAQCAFTTSATFQKRVTAQIFGGDALSALTGSFDVWVRCRSTADNNTMKIGMAWALGQAPSADAFQFAPTQTLDSLSYYNEYVLVKLGRIYIPPALTLDGITIQVYAERDSGSGSLKLDCLTFASVDEGAAVVEVRPYTSGAALNEYLTVDPSIPEARHLDALVTSTPTWKRSDTAQQNSGAATTIAKTLGQAPVAGDLLLALLFTTSNASTTAHTAPAGWTQIGGIFSTGASNERYSLWYKVATGSEGTGPFTWGWTTASTALLLITVYTGVDPNNPINASGQGSANGAGSITAASLTPSADGTLIVDINLSVANGAITPPAGTTERVELDSGAPVGSVESADTPGPAKANIASGTRAYTEPNADGGTVSVALKPAAHAASPVGLPAQIAGPAFWYEPGLNLVEVWEREKRLLTPALRSQATTSNNASVTMTMPATIVAGDLLVLVAQGTSNVLSPPAGWTIVSNNLNAPRLLAWKIAGPAEPTTIILTGSAAKITGCIAAYRNVQAQDASVVTQGSSATPIGSSINPGMMVQQANIGGVTTGGVRASLPNDILLLLMAVSSATVIGAPAGMTIDSHIEDATNAIACAIISLAVPTPGATGDKTATSGNALWSTWMSLFTAAPGVWAPVPLARADVFELDYEPRYRS